MSRFLSRYRATLLLLAISLVYSSTGNHQALAAESNATYVLRPHCVHGYGEDEDWSFGPIPAPGFVVETGEGICSFFEVTDPQTLTTAPLQVGDVLDMDVVIYNPDKLPITRARAWLNYDSNILQGTAVTISEEFPQITPGESDFSAEEGYVKIEASADKDSAPDTFWVKVARVQLTVKKHVPSGTVINFFDVQSTGHSAIMTEEDDDETSILGDEPGHLLVQLAGDDHTAPGDSEPLPNGSTCTQSAQCASNYCAEGTCQTEPSTPPGTGPGEVGSACTENSDCTSGVCFQNICQATGMKLPNGATCERDNQCLSLLCQAGVCSDATNLPIGENCTANAECASGFCDSGICALDTASSLPPTPPSFPGPAGPGPGTSGPGGAGTTPIGGVCTSNNQCTSGLCADGTCQTVAGTGQPGSTPTLPPAPGLLPNGADCVNNVQCSSNLCVQGICRDAPPTSQPNAGQRTAFSLLQVQNVRVTTEGSSVYLAWDELPSSILQGYNVYYGTTTGQYIQRKSVPDTPTSITVRNLPVGTTYYFAVRAVSIANEESAFSQEVSIEVGNPTTSTAPLTGDILGGNDDDQPVTKPISAGSTDTLPGATGSASTLALLLLLSAAIGTVLASRRQFMAMPTLKTHD